MDLGNRRGRERNLVERGEDGLDRLTELRLDDGPHRCERLRRHLVPQRLELGDELFGEEALAPGDDLTELHVRGAESLEGALEPTGDARARLLAPPFRDVPPRQREANRAGHPQEPANRWDARRRGEPGHLGARAGPHAVEPPAPLQRFGIDDPRRLGAERADREVCGACTGRGRFRGSDAFHATGASVRWVAPASALRARSRLRSAYPNRRQPQPLRP